MISKGVLFEQFVGREEELALLVELREKTARQSAPSCVTITGTAGIGKSRLLREFLRRSARARGAVLDVPCDSVVPTPYAALLLLLESASALSREFPPIEDACATLRRVQTGEEALDSERESKLHHASITALQLFAARRGHLVLIVEDAHACDVASLVFFSMLMGRSKHAPIFLIATARENGDSDLSRAEALSRIERGADYRILMEPLPVFSLAKAIESALPRASRDDAREIAKRSEGNPFFAQELARVSRDTSGSSMPSSLRAATIGRFETLSAEQLYVMRSAAVIGREFDVALLGEIVEQDDRVVDAAVRAIREAGAIVEKSFGTFSFTHALLRDSLEESMPSVEAKRLHTRVADALENRPRSRESLFSIAWHRWMAEDREKSIAANELAADDAALINAHAEAAECYERVLSLISSDGDDFLRVAAKATKSLATVGRISRALSLAEDVIRRFKARSRPADALDTLTLTIPWAMNAGESELADRLIAEAREIAGDVDDADRRVALETAIAQVAILQSKATHALDILGRVQPYVPDCLPITSFRYHNARALASFACSSAAAALTDLERSIEIARHEQYVRGELVATNNFCGISIEIGRAAHVRERTQRALAHARTTDFGYAKALLAITTIRANIAVGALGYAAGEVREAIDMDSPFRQWNAELLAMGFYVASLMSDEALAARASIDEAIDKALETALPVCIANVSSYAARATLNANPEASKAFLNMGWIDGTFPAINFAIVECVSVMGTTEQKECVRSALVQNCSDPIYVAAKPRLLFFDAAVCVSQNRAIEGMRLAKEAAEGFAMLGMPLEEAACRELNKDVSAAISIYNRIGAKGEESRLDVAQARAAPAEMLTLTGREEQVCRLIAMGLTNKEAAAKLSIGARTAETHLANAYRKLGLRTRSELADYLRTAARDT